MGIIDRNVILAGRQQRRQHLKYKVGVDSITQQELHKALKELKNRKAPVLII